MSLTSGSTAELKELIKNDIGQIHRYQARIDQLRQDIKDGKGSAKGHVLGDIMSESKKPSKELARRINTIEDKPKLDATDREYLQVLNARQFVWDRHNMQIAELNDLMYQGRTGTIHTAADDEAPANTDQQSSEGKVSPKHVNKGETGFSMSSADIQEVEEEMLAGSYPARASTMHAPLDAGDGDVSKKDQQAPETEHVDGGDHEADDELGDHDEDEEDEDWEPDEPSWPILYQIMDVDPKTDRNDVCTELEK